MSVTKQKSSAGKNVFVFFLVFIILEMLIIFGITKVFKNKDSAPSVAGYSFYIMDNANMGDAIPKGTLVAVSNSSPSREKIGKAVLCKNVEGVGTDVFWLSDVVSEAEGLDGVIYKVYQSNDKTKFYSVKTDDVVGVASTHLPTLGKIIVFVRSKFGMAVCAGVPLFILIVLEIIIAIVTRTPKPKKYEEDDFEEVRETVELDDFLFGGKDEGEQIAKRKKMLESRMNEKENEKEEKVLVTAGAAEKTEAEGDSSENEEPVDDSEGSDIDRSYYEKASKFLDDGEEPEEQADAAEEKPARPEPKAAAASLEDLMKLMENEQNKLKKQLEKNQPKQ